MEPCSKPQPELKLIVGNGKIRGRPNYKKLYHAANNRLTDLYLMIVAAQQDLEDMYLSQTEPLNYSEHLQAFK